MQGGLWLSQDEDRRDQHLEQDIRKLIEDHSTSTRSPRHQVIEAQTRRLEQTELGLLLLKAPEISVVANQKVPELKVTLFVGWKIWATTLTSGVHRRLDLEGFWRSTHRNRPVTALENALVFHSREVAVWLWGSYNTPKLSGDTIGEGTERINLQQLISNGYFVTVHRNSPVRPSDISSEYALSCSFWQWLVLDVGTINTPDLPFEGVRS